MLCPPGDAVDFFESGATSRDGTTPVNVSGGLESKGHPIAATGIANIWEVCHHLRGEDGDRQIQGATVDWPRSSASDPPVGRTSWKRALPSRPDGPPRSGQPSPLNSAVTWAMSK